MSLASCPQCRAPPGGGERLVFALKHRPACDVPRCSGICVLHRIFPKPLPALQSDALAPAQRIQRRPTARPARLLGGDASCQEMGKLREGFQPPATSGRSRRSCVRYWPRAEEGRVEGMIARRLSSSDSAKSAGETSGRFGPCHLVQDEVRRLVVRPELAQSVDLFLALRRLAEMGAAVITRSSALASTCRVQSFMHGARRARRRRGTLQHVISGRRHRRGGGGGSRRPGIEHRGRRRRREMLGNFVSRTVEKHLVQPRGREDGFGHALTAGPGRN